jgi:hypothetical protein
VLLQTTARGHFNITLLIGGLDQLAEGRILKLQVPHGLLRRGLRDLRPVVGVSLVLLNEGCNAILALHFIRVEDIRIIDIVWEGGAVGSNFAFLRVPVHMDDLM